MIDSIKHKEGDQFNPSDLSDQVFIEVMSKHNISLLPSSIRTRHFCSGKCLTKFLESDIGKDEIHQIRLVKSGFIVTTTYEGEIFNHAIPIIMTKSYEEED